MKALIQMPPRVKPANSISALHKVNVPTKHNPKCPLFGDIRADQPTIVVDVAPVAAKEAPEKKPEKTEADNPLSEEQKKSLIAYEKIVSEGEAKGLEVAVALSEVHQQRLYRETHTSYDKYCEEKWGFQRSHANRLKNAGVAYSAIKSLHAKDKSVRMPTSESQLRPLGGMMEEAIQNAWKQAMEKAGKGKITANMVQEVVDAAKQKQPKERAKAREKIDLEKVRTTFMKLHSAIKKRELDEAEAFAEEVRQLLKVGEEAEAIKPEADANEPVEATEKAELTLTKE